MSTAGEPIKFRCFQCNTKLRVSRAKAGSVVACPRCAIELIVPDPEDAAADGDAGGESGTGQAIRNLVSTEPPTPAASPHPFAPPPAEGEGEAPFLGIVVEQETSLRPKPRSSSPPPASRPSPPPPQVATAPVSPPPLPPGTPSSAEAPGYPVIRTEPADAPTPAAPVTFPVVAAEPLAIRPESPSRLTERASLPRRNDVVMPRTAVVLWSFFALVALVLAFAAGLLLGHFVWVQPPAPSPSAAPPAVERTKAADGPMNKPAARGAGMGP